MVIHKARCGLGRLKLRGHTSAATASNVMYILLLICLSDTLSSTLVAAQEQVFEDQDNFTNTLTVSMSNAFEQQRYDGWYNNLGHPDWGATEAHLTRKTPPSYSDGVYAMSGENRPSPRQLSQAFMKGFDGLGSLKNRTALQTFFGQVGRLICDYIKII